MKTKLLLAFLLLYISAKAQIINIPDANFKATLIDSYNLIDKNNDGEIQKSEAEAAVSLWLNYSDATDFTGIEAFKNITQLYFSNTHVTSINLTKCLYLNRIECTNTDLTSLDVSLINNLSVLKCNANVNLHTICVNQNQLNNKVQAWQKDILASWSICTTGISENNNDKELIFVRAYDLTGRVINIVEFKGIAIIQYSLGDSIVYKKTFLN